MSAIAVLAKAEILDEKIVPQAYVNDVHIEKHTIWMQSTFKMKYNYESRFNADRGAKKSAILGNEDWRLKLNEYDLWKSSIRELWTGESAFVEWRFLPRNDFEFTDDFVDPKEIFIVKNFMIIRMFEDGHRDLFLNLTSRKLFWIREDDLENKIV